MTLDWTSFTLGAGEQRALVLVLAMLSWMGLFE